MRSNSNEGELSQRYLIDPQVVPLERQQVSADLDATPGATKIQVNLAEMCKGFDEADTSCVPLQVPLPLCPPPVDLKVLRADEVREAAEVSAQAVSETFYRIIWQPYIQNEDKLVPLASSLDQLISNPGCATCIYHHELAAREPYNMYHGENLVKTFASAFHPNS